MFWVIFCISIFFIEFWHILILWLAKMPNGGMPVFTLIATGWRYRKIFFYKKKHRTDESSVQDTGGGVCNVTFSTRQDQLYGSRFFNNIMKVYCVVKSFFCPPGLRSVCYRKPLAWSNDIRWPLHITNLKSLLIFYVVVCKQTERN